MESSHMTGSAAQLQVKLETERDPYPTMHHTELLTVPDQFVYDLFY